MLSNEQCDLRKTYLYISQQCVVLESNSRCCDFWHFLQSYTEISSSEFQSILSDGFDVHFLPTYSFCKTPHFNMSPEASAPLPTNGVEISKSPSTTSSPTPTSTSKRTPQKLGPRKPGAPTQQSFQSPHAQEVRSRDDGESDQASTSGPSNRQNVSKQVQQNPNESQPNSGATSKSRRRNWSRGRNRPHQQTSNPGAPQSSVATSEAGTTIRSPSSGSVVSSNTSVPPPSSYSSAKGGRRQRNRNRNPSISSTSSKVSQASTTKAFHTPLSAPPSKQDVTARTAEWVDEDVQDGTEEEEKERNDDNEDMGLSEQSAQPLDTLEEADETTHHITTRLENVVIEGHLNTSTFPNSNGGNNPSQSGTAGRRIVAGGGQHSPRWKGKNKAKLNEPQEETASQIKNGRRRSGARRMEPLLDKKTSEIETETNEEEEVDDDDDDEDQEDGTLESTTQGKNQLKSKNEGKSKTTRSRNKKKGKGDEPRPLKLRLELDLDLELELKARIKGDITIAVL